MMNKFLNYLLAALLVIAIAYIGWEYFNPKVEKIYVQVKPKPEIIYVEKPDGTTQATTTIIREEHPSFDIDSLKEKWGNLIPKIEQRTDKISELTEIKGKLETELTKLTAEKTALIAENQNLKGAVQVWQGKYYQFVADESGKGKLTGDLHLKIAGIQQDKSGKSIQITATSDDPDFKVNGMEVYRQDFKVKQPNVGLTAEISAGKVVKQDYSARLRAEVLFRPNSLVVPFVYGQYGIRNEHLSNFDKNWQPEIGGGVKFKIKF